MDLCYLPIITYKSLLPTNYYRQTIIHESLLPIYYRHNNYIHNIKNIIII